MRTGGKCFVIIVRRSSGGVWKDGTWATNRPGNHFDGFIMHMHHGRSDGEGLSPATG